MADITLTRLQKHVSQFNLESRICIQGLAGAGKTTASVSRLAYLIHRKVRSDSILVVLPQRTLAVPFQELLQNPAYPPGGLVSIMTIGGLAVSIWGQPRLTRDVYVKVLARRDERAKVLHLLADYTPLHANPDEAFRRQGLAFFQDQDGTRVDILLAETSFDETALGRAKAIEIEPGQSVRVCTAEDLIVYKMVSVRTQDRVDVEGIIQRQADERGAAQGAPRRDQPPRRLPRRLAAR